MGDDRRDVAIVLGVVVLLGLPHLLLGPSITADDWVWIRNGEFIAWWDAGGLEVEQFFMRELSEEHALLLTLAERMAERPVLVTFNGKSFDWPLLETRYRMTRKIKSVEPRAHLDFLHPARNLWRVRLGSVFSEDRVG